MMRGIRDRAQRTRRQQTAAAIRKYAERVTRSGPQSRQWRSTMHDTLVDIRNHQARTSDWRAALPSLHNSQPWRWEVDANAGAPLPRPEPSSCIHRSRGPRGRHQLWSSA